MVNEVFEMPCQMPQLNENTGYILVLCYNSSEAEYFVRMYHWSYYYHYNFNSGGEVDGYDFAFDSRITIAVENDWINFSPVKVNNFNHGSFTVSYISSYGFYDVLHYDSFANGTGLESYSYDMESDVTICGYQVMGNCENVTDNSLSSKLNFSVIWGNDLAEYNTLLNMLDVCNKIAAYDKSIYDQMVILNNTSTQISSRIQSIANLLGTWLVKIDSELDVHTGLLKEIRDLLNTTGESDFEKVDGSSVSNHNQAGEALLNNSNSTSSKANLNVSLNTSASSTVWGMINNFVGLNASVMGFFIALLSLGVVALILNR